MEKPKSKTHYTHHVLVCRRLVFSEHLTISRILESREDTKRKGKGKGEEKENPFLKLPRKQPDNFNVDLLGFPRKLGSALLCGKCGKHFAPRGHYPHFLDKESEAWSSSVSHPGSHSSHI